MASFLSLFEITSKLVSMQCNIFVVSLSLQFVIRNAAIPLTESNLKPSFNLTSKMHTTQESQLRQRLPSALIIGVKKGGTRALLQFIRMHPEVRAPGPEIHFFDKNFHRGTEWYRYVCVFCLHVFA